jgi:hypothetical protein
MTMMSTIVPGPTPLSSLLSVERPEYIAIAVAVVAVTLVTAFGGTGGNHRRWLNGIFGTAVTLVVVYNIASKAFVEGPETASRRALVAMASELEAQQQHERGQGDTVHQKTGRERVNRTTIEGTTTMTLRPDLFFMRRERSSDSFTGMNPDVSAALLHLKAYTRSNIGTVKFILASVEEFFRRYYDLLDEPRRSRLSGRTDEEYAKVSHGFSALRDLRGSILNSLTSLSNAKPHAHGLRAKLQEVIDTVKWRTYRCLKTLHNKYGEGALRAHARGPPYAHDPMARVSDASYTIHVV